MSAKKKGLGKGLDALLGGGAISSAMEENSSEKSAEHDKVQGLKELPVEFLQRGKYQPRKDMNPAALDELAESIRRQGIMQPIMVRPLAKDSYEIVAGERRWRAAQLAGLASIPVIVKVISDEDAIAMALIENIQREDLNAMEEALALTRLQEEFGYSQREVAEAVGKPRSTVANLMRLTALQPEVAVLLERGDIDMGHGRALLGLGGSNQLEVAKLVVGKGLTVRQTEALVRQWQNQQHKPAQVPGKNPDIQRLEQSLSEQLGAGINIQHGSSGKGKIVIRYNSLDELDGILTHIK